MRQRIRRALVLVTVVAVVIGPQWCCCTLKAVASPSAIADEATGGCGCCCCDTSAAESASACPLKSGDGAGRHSCPCRGKPRPVAATLGGFAPGGDRAVDSWVGWDGTWNSACGLTVVVAYLRPEVHGVPAVDAPPMPAGRALLCALGILRC